VAGRPTPDNWTFPSDPPEPGPAVLVDVDGVIADGWHRQHHLQNGKRDWKNFFAAADLDQPIEGSIQLLEQFDTGLTVVLLTARPDYLRGVTVDWVVKHGYRWEVLVMRGHRDGGLSSPEFKRRSLAELRERGYEPTLALDDDQRNVDMFRSEGIPTLYIHSGYYEA
jgi:hypothetical protein